ncbi:MAG: hypothetical protein ACOCQR_03435 [bacterium]
MSAIMDKQTESYINHLEKRYPVIMQEHFSRFIAMACRRVEEIGIENGVEMVFDPHKYEVKIEGKVYESQIEFLKEEAKKKVKEELAWFLSRTKIQTIIEKEAERNEKNGRKRLP